MRGEASYIRREHGSPISIQFAFYAQYRLRKQGITFKIHIIKKAAPFLSSKDTQYSMVKWPNNTHINKQTNKCFGF